MVRIFCLIIVMLWALPLQAAELEPLKIKTGDGETHHLQVEVVEKDETRARGLMFRTEMPEDHGMLFWFQNVAPRSFWMKNTFIPLDIIYIDDQGKIVSIKQGTPLSEDSIPSEHPARAALELNQGTAEARGIAVGDHVIHPRFDTAN